MKKKKNKHSSNNNEIIDQMCKRSTNTNYYETKLDDFLFSIYSGEQKCLHTR